MQDRTALWIWKTLAIGALGTCATLLLRTPSAAAVRQRDDEASSVVDFDEPGWLPTSRHDGRASDLTKLSRDVDQARSPQSRCAALSRLARSRDVDSVAVNHIASYSKRDHMIEVRMCATAALGETQSEEAVAPLVELIDDHVAGVAEAALMGLMQLDDHSAREAVIEAARSGTESLRLAALRALAVEGDPQAFGLITAALKDAHPNLQDQLVMILGSTHDPRAAALLHGYLTSGTRRMQYMALNALGELGGPRAESVLIGVLRESPSLAVAACQALSRSESEEVVEALLEGAEGDYGPQVAAAALQALTQRQSQEITALMMGALNGGSPNQINVAAEYFANHGIESAVPALTALAQKGGPYTWNIVAALGRIGGDAARSTIEKFAQAPGMTGQAALQILATLPGGMESAREVALVQLERGAGAQGPQLLQLLGNDDSPEAQAALLAAARSADPNLSAQALSWLGQRKDPESIRTLQDLVTHGSTPGQRAMALGALTQSGDPSAQAHLQAALKDQSPEVRTQAVQALLESGAPGSEPALLEATRDQDANVVMTATFALAQLGTPAALSRLESVARERPDVGPQALQALANAAPERARSIAEAFAVGSDPQARLAAVQVAGMLPPESSKKILVSAVRSDDSMAVREAIGQLSNLGLPREELQGLLLPVLQNPDMPEDVTQMATHMLGGT